MKELVSPKIWSNHMFGGSKKFKFIVFLGIWWIPAVLKKDQQQVCVNTTVNIFFFFQSITALIY